MPTWDELIKGRTKISSLRNSVHMLKCIKQVLAVRPNAKIVSVDKNSWKLQDGEQDLSNAHSSHYACYAEAAKILKEAS
jgi:hypothetical protein